MSIGNDRVIADDRFAGGISSGCIGIPFSISALNCRRTHQVVTLVASKVGQLGFAIPVSDTMVNGLGLRTGGRLYGFRQDQEPQKYAQAPSHYLATIRSAADVSIYRGSLKKGKKALLSSWRSKQSRQSVCIK